MAPTSYSIELSPKAESDLAEIAAYTLERWGAGQMETYMAELDATIRGLGERPERGLNRDHMQPGLKSVTHRTRHHIFYRIRGEFVQIVRILHTRRNMAVEISRST